jgi:hypothetical protein
MKLDSEKVTVSISGEAAISALGALYEQLSIDNKQLSIDKAGYAGIEMFLQLFGEEMTEKLLRFCEKNPEKAARIFARIIRRNIYPLAVRQRKYNDKQGVKKYL